MIWYNLYKSMSWCRQLIQHWSICVGFFHVLEPCCKLSWLIHCCRLMPEDPTLCGLWYILCCWLVTGTLGAQIQWPVCSFWVYLEKKMLPYVAILQKVTLKVLSLLTIIISVQMNIFWYTLKYSKASLIILIHVL